MVNVVSDQRIANQIGDFFGGAAARTRERTGTSLAYEELVDRVPREDSHAQEFVHGMRTTIREHLCHESKALRAQSMAVQTRCCIVLVLMVALFFVAGCGIHLHRPADAQLARTAAAAFKDAKLTDALKTEFDAAAEMLNSEVAALRRQSNARRDRLISAIIGGTSWDTSWGCVVEYADKRLVELLGPKQAKDDWLGLKDWLDARNNTFPLFDTVRAAYLMYEQERRKKTGPRITRIGSRLSEAEKSKLEKQEYLVLRTIYDNYLNALSTYEAAVKKANAQPSNEGIVCTIITSLNAQEKKLRDANEAAIEVKDQLDQVKKERDDRIAEADAPGKKADEISKALKEAAVKTDEAKSILKGLLDGASDRGLTGVQEKIMALEEIRGQIAEFLSVEAAAVTGKKPSPGESEKIKLLASLTAIRAGIDGATYPRVSDLILESERLRIELDRLRGLIALEEERKALFDLQLTALSREIVALRRAHQRAQQPAKGEPRSVLAAEKSPINQEAAADALAYIAESWSGGRTPAEEIDFLICGIDHRAALENSSAAFAQWANLIGVPLSQLVAYHESGIKSGDLANLINAAGFSAIAAGVF